MDSMRRYAIIRRFPPVDSLHRQFQKITTTATTIALAPTTILLDKEQVSTSPILSEKDDILTNEGLLPQKTIDYNSIADEFADQNNTAVDLVMQTQLKTQPATTPEPSKFVLPFYSFILLHRKIEVASWHHHISSSAFK